MKIRIIDSVDDGTFIVGNVYDVSHAVNSTFVYAIDEDGSMEPVYSYQFVVVENTHVQT